MNNAGQHIEDQLGEFRVWRAGRALKSARLVQYCGHECLGGHDIRMREVEDEIRCWLNQGFRVDWAEKRARLYLCVSESVDHPLDWRRIFEEKHLSDIDAILRQAGFIDDEDSKRAQP